MQLRAFSRALYPRSGFVFHSLLGPWLLYLQVSGLVLLHHYVRPSIGGCRLHFTDPVIAGRPILHDLLCSSILFHSHCAALLLGSNIHTIISVMISRVGREFAPMPPIIILCTFIVVDIVATVLQVFETAGAALVGVPNSAGSDPKRSNRLLLAGLAIQVASFGIFIVCLCWFAIKSRKATSAALKQFLAAVLVAALAVYIRTCFRLAETVQGLSKSLATHEVFFGCLEFLPVVSAMYILMYWHPGRWLGSKRSPGKALMDKQPGECEG